jgi:hypothetical protein
MLHVPPILHDLTGPEKLCKEALHYVIFSALLLLPLSLIDIFLALSSHTPYVLMFPETANLLLLLSLSSEMFFLRQIVDVSCSGPPMSKQDRNSTNAVLPSSRNATLASNCGFVFVATESMAAISFLRPFSSLSEACRSEEKVCEKQIIHHNAILESGSLATDPRLLVQNHHVRIEGCQM